METLRFKLFLAIAGGTAALALAGYLVFSWSFDRGFVEYVNQADEARLEPLVERLGQAYGEHGGWTWLLEDRRRFYALVRETVALPPLTIDPRVMLFDAAGDRLFGRAEAAPRAVLRAIEWQGATVGYLGTLPRPEVLESLEQLYLKRQHGAFTAIALGMLAAALLLGAAISHWLSGRIRTLAGATSRLIDGDYSVRVPPAGNDDLSRLASHLNSLAQTLCAAREARQRWLADIAHELRTPLSILRGELEALQDGVRPLNRDAVNSLATEAARLGRLVEDLHTLSLSDLGALTYHREPVDLSEVASDVLDSQGRAIAEKGLKLERHLDPGAVLSGDADRLAQVFGNLLQNSLRYTDAPGVISLKTRKENGAVKACWEDSSPGVPQEDLPRLTERLFRVDGSRNRASGGSGLGLAITRAIVEAHGGRLAASASALGGLRIDLEFPAHG